MAELTIRYVLVRHEDGEPVFTSAGAASLAGISLSELETWRGEGLVHPRTLSDGTIAYSLRDVHELACIARLQQEIDLDLEAIEVVLHLRAQVLDAYHRMEALRRSFVEREQELLDTITQLRRGMASEARWR
jgi:DNA-binding transcriptional MerR regulator